jgi:hypothetical protein
LPAASKRSAATTTAIRRVAGTTPPGSSIERSALWAPVVAGAIETLSGTALPRGSAIVSALVKVPSLPIQRRRTVADEEGPDRRVTKIVRSPRSPAAHPSRS